MFIAKSIGLSKFSVKPFYQKAFSDDGVEAHLPEHSAIGGVIAVVTHTKHVAFFDVEVEILIVNCGLLIVYIIFNEKLSIEIYRIVFNLDVVAADCNHAFYKRSAGKIPLVWNENHDIPPFYSCQLLSLIHI